MNRSILAGLLALQILIVAGVYAWNLREPERPDQFFDFDLDEITQVEIRADDQTVQVLRQEEDWRLADGKPADGDKIERVLEKLVSASTGWPVATSSSTAARFEVTEDTFQKRLTLYAGEDIVADTYFGTSPSFRLTHISDVDGGTVYAIEFSNYELGDDHSSWLDKNLLRPQGDMTMLRHEGQYTLNQSEDQWVEASEVELDSEAVKKVVDRFRNLSVYTISDAELPDAPVATLAWQDDAGETSLQLFHLEEDDEWVATSDRVEGQYGISTYIAKDMALKLEDLLPQEEDENSDEPEEPETVSIGHDH